MGQLRDPFALLSNNEIEAIKMTQEIIKRMAENSAKTKTVFLAITTAMITLVDTEISLRTVFALSVYLILTFALWQTDAQYLRLERLFREHHNAICDGTITALDQWRLNIGKYDAESTYSIMFKNFTMWIYYIGAGTTVILLIYVIGHLPAR